MSRRSGAHAIRNGSSDVRKGATRLNMRGNGNGWGSEKDEWVLIGPHLLLWLSRYLNAGVFGVLNFCLLWRSICVTSFLFCVLSIESDLNQTKFLFTLFSANNAALDRTRERGGGLLSPRLICPGALALYTPAGYVPGQHKHSTFRSCMAPYLANHIILC